MPASRRLFEAGFNPRVLAGGRDFGALWGHHGQIVSIHASSREDATHGIGNCSVRDGVSIHASSREDATFSFARSGTASSFNPRVLAGGRDWHNPRRRDHGEFQSTRPRGRTRPGKKGGRGKEIISIHASSREDATGSNRRSLSSKTFQSTRPRGRTRL